MCDDHSLDDMTDYSRRSGELTRRRFGALWLGGGLSVLLPGLASATELIETEVMITTPDGKADGYFVHPATGVHPGVLLWTDILGLRAAFKLMARRLAESGYSVLVPNPFYRITPAPVVPPGSSLQDDATRKIVMGMMASLTPAIQVTDATAFVTWLDAQASVDQQRKMGTAGYCMGGPLTMRTAATFPQRIGAAASFHGARLTTGDAASPHLLIPKMQAHYLIAIADNDDQRDPDAKVILRQAFDKAQLSAEIEVYPAKHGWCPPDSPVYDEAQAEKAWQRMTVLFKKALV